MRYIKFVVLFLLCACMPYRSPDRASWANYLNGASFTDMTEISRTAKQPIFLGAGGKTLEAVIDKSNNLDYGDKAANDNMAATQYMISLENALYDTLRKPGISVQRAGTEVVVILVRDAIMKLSVAEISETGDDTLKKISNILNDYPATFIEIAGYTDSMRDQNAAYALSLNMAQRVGVYFAEHAINPTRLFIVGRGAARPIAAQDNIGRLTNRRIELRIVPVR